MESSTEPDGRLLTFGNQLIEIHIWLREELATLRANVESYLDGGGQRPRNLRAHCLTFCSAVTRHHEGEDAGAFRVLGQQVPELRPVLEELARDHRLVAVTLRTLDGLLSGLDTTADPAEMRRVRSELDGLAALLESHFVYEERRIVAALNSLRFPSRDGAGAGAGTTTEDPVTFLLGLRVDGSTAR